MAWSINSVSEGSSSITRIVKGAGALRRADRDSAAGLVMTLLPFRQGNRLVRFIRQLSRASCHRLPLIIRPTDPGEVTEGRKREDHRGARPVRRFNPYLPAVQLDDALHNGQPDSASLDRPRIQPDERLEDPLTQLRRDAYSVVYHSALHLAVHPRHCNTDEGIGSITGKFDGVRDEIVEHLPKVSPMTGHHPEGGLNGDLHAAAFKLTSSRLEHVLQH